MKSDRQLQKDVMAELAWEPFLHSSEIAVSVKSGIVTLFGEVDAYLKKLTAEKAAKRVSGVKAVVENIHVCGKEGEQRTDTEIALAILNALKWNTAVQENKITIKVENGHVRLDGEVDWDYQRVSAASAIAHITGVKSIISHVTIKPAVKMTQIAERIHAALKRNAGLDAAKIRIKVSGHKVVLSGTVRSFAEKEDAERAAWSAQGVLELDSKIQVSPAVLVEEPRLAGNQSE